METIQKSKLLIYFCWIWELLIECFYTAFQNNFNSYNKMNCELMLTYDIPAYMFNVHKNQLSRQTRSRNLTGPKWLPTIWHTYMKLVTKYQIPVINSCWEKCDEKCAYTNVWWMCIKINKVGKQEVGIRWVQKRFPRYEVPIWSLWPNIRFLSSIVAEKNAMKNVDIQINDKCI